MIVFYILSKATTIKYDYYKISSLTATKVNTPSQSISEKTNYNPSKILDIIIKDYSPTMKITENPITLPAWTLEILNAQ